MTFPLQQPIAIFLMVLMIILLGPLLFKRLKVPAVVGMIIAGMAVGPYGFHLLERDASFAIFGEVGILYIMFLAAVEIDMFHLRQQLNRGLLFGLLSFLLPMTAGILCSRYVFDASWTTCVLLASMYASHTLISYPTVSKFGLQNNKGAVIAVCGTIVCVMLALVSLAAVVDIRVSGSFSWLKLLRLFGLLIVYAAVIGYIFPLLTRKFFRTTNDTVSQFIFILALVFIASLIAKIIGLEAILGAFYAGLVLNRMIPSRSALMARIKFTGNAIFIPYFLIGVGMLINVGVIFRGWGVAWVALNMTATALLTKGIACWIAQKTMKLSRLDGNIMFGLTSGKAAATIAATMIGFNYGLLTEDMMNGAVVMIMVCCLISSIVTESAAKRLKMNIVAEDLGKDRKGSNREARQLVAVANPQTAEGIMTLSTLMRDRRNHNEITCLFVRNHEDPAMTSMGRNALQVAVGVGLSMDVEVKDVERYDINIVSGITNVVKERGITDIIIGLHRRTNVVDTFYGVMIQQLLAATNLMIIMSRCFIPIDTLKTMYVVVPMNAEYEEGFHSWIERIAQLASQTRNTLTIIAYRRTADLMEQYFADNKLEVRRLYRKMENWDDFILLSAEIGDEDLIVVIGSRKGSISYTSDMDSLTNYLGKHFSRHNLLVIYPAQF